MMYPRAVAYCINRLCEEQFKGVFQLNSTKKYWCPHCRFIGRVEPEQASYTGTFEVFREVRVEYLYNPLQRCYKGLAVIRDESIPENQANVYLLQSPLVSNSKRALILAENILHNLNRCAGTLKPGMIPSTSEMIVSLDDPSKEFSRSLEHVSQAWSRQAKRLEAYRIG